MPLVKGQAIGSPGTGGAGLALLAALDKATKPSKPTCKLAIEHGGYFTLPRTERRFRGATLDHLVKAGLVVVNGKQDRIALTPAGQKLLGA